MKLPRIRFSTRRMMVVVAVAALAIWIVRLWALRQHYLEKAANHAGFRAYVLNSADSIRHWEYRWTDAHGETREIPVACGAAVRSGHRQVSR